MFYELSRYQILDFYVNSAFIFSKMVCIDIFSPEWKYSPDEFIIFNRESISQYFRYSRVC